MKLSDVRKKIVVPLTIEYIPCSECGNIMLLIGQRECLKRGYDVYGCKDCKSEIEIEEEFLEEWPKIYTVTNNYPCMIEYTEPSKKNNNDDDDDEISDMNYFIKLIILDLNNTTNV